MQRTSSWCVRIAAVVGVAVFGPVMGAWADATPPSYLLGWYDSSTRGRSLTNFSVPDAGPALIARDGLGWSIAYNDPGNIATATAYLNAASQEGVKVILHVGQGQRGERRRQRGGRVCLGVEGPPGAGGLVHLRRAR